MKAFILTAPLLIGGLLALNFPYYGASLSYLGFSILLALSVFNFLPIALFQNLNRQIFNIRLAASYAIGFIAMPCIQLLVAKLLTHETSVFMAIALSALAPVAIVAPQFAQGKDKANSILLILISTLAFPIISSLFLWMLNFNTTKDFILPFIKDSILLSALPIVLCFFAQKFFISKLPEQFAKRAASTLPFINMLLIGFLVFIYVGSSFAKSNLSSVSFSLALALVINALLQDFGTYFIMRSFGFNRSEAINYSIKNVALAGAIVLSYVPAGIMACTIIFAAHFLFFTFLFLTQAYSEPQNPA